METPFLSCSRGQCNVMTVRSDPGFSSSLLFLANQEEDRNEIDNEFLMQTSDMFSYFKFDSN